MKDVLYHGTAAVHIDSIKQHGLVPGMHDGADDVSERAMHRKHHWANPDDDQKFVYLTPSPEMAAQFADFVARGTQSDPMFVLVNLPDNFGLQIDPRCGPMWPNIAYRYAGIIPPDMIARIERAPATSNPFYIVNDGGDTVLSC